MPATEIYSSGVALLMIIMMQLSGKFTFAKFLFTMIKYFTLFFCLPICLLAQEKNSSDTVITKDPLNPKREYWSIHNSSGIVKAQGFMLDGKKDGVWRYYEQDN